MKKLNLSTDEKFDILIERIETLQINVSGLKTDMKYVKENVNDLIETTSEIASKVVTLKEYADLKKRVALLEQS